MQHPDFRTISDFRKRHLEALGDLFVQVLKLCQKAGLVKLGHVALDGSKIPANASKRKAMSYKRMNEREKELAEKVAKWFADADAADSCEDEALGDRIGDELPDWVKNDQARLDKIRVAKAALEAEAKAAAEAEEERKRRGDPPTGKNASFTKDGKPKPKAQRNFTDPQSRIMKTSDGFVQGYNAQIAVEAKAQVIVAQLVVNEQNDGPFLPTMLAAIKQNTGKQAAEISADSNFCSEANLAECARRRIDAFIAIGRQLHGRPVADKGRAPAPGSRAAAMREKLART